MKDTCKNSFQFPATILILILIVGCSVKVADFFGISILHSTSTDASLRTENYIFEETKPNILSLPALPAGAAGEPIILPDIHVKLTYSETELSSMTGNLENNLFPQLTADPASILTVDLESSISVIFENGRMPQEIMIEDMVLDESGNILYDPETIDTQTLTVDANSIQWYLLPNQTALNSTDAKTYQSGGVLRGFRMNCYWSDGTEMQCAWAIRTDAACNSKGKTGSASLQLAGCGTGVPILNDIESVKMTAKGPVVKMTMYSQYDAYTYDPSFTLNRITGNGYDRILPKDDYTFGTRKSTLKPGWGKTVTLNIGKAYGPLEPGYYTVSKKLINKETGETYTVSGGFQIAE